MNEGQIPSVGIIDGLGVLRQLRHHLAQLSPHVSARQSGRLIAAAIGEIERLNNIIDAANFATTAECTCGGNPKDDPDCCPACAVYHRIEAAKVRFAPDKTKTPWSDWSDANRKAIEAAEGASAEAPPEEGAHQARCSLAVGSGLWDVLENMARQHCHTAKVARDYNGQVAGTYVTDSGGLSANAAALQELRSCNPPRFRVVASMGRMVVGYWPENDPNAGDVPTSGTNGET